MSCGKGANPEEGSNSATTIHKLPPHAFGFFPLPLLVGVRASAEEVESWELHDVLPGREAGVGVSSRERSGSGGSEETLALLLAFLRGGETDPPSRVPGI